MIVTPIRLFHLPVTYAMRNANRTTMEDYYTANEVIAWLEGKPSSPVYLSQMQWGEYDCSLHELLEENDLPLPPKPFFVPFKLKTSDGKEVFESRGSLRRRFHLIDDYLNDFPDETSMSIPYPEEVLLAAVMINPKPLAEVDACLCHLNPKEAMYYFYFDTKGSKPERLLEIARLLSQEEVSSILDRNTDGAKITIPLNGLGTNFLAYILSVCRDLDNAEALFSDYPSFLTMFYLGMGDWDRIAQRLYPCN